MDNKSTIKIIKYLVIILLPIFCIMIFGIYKEVVCSQEKCNNFKVKNGKYCSEHTCEIDGCFNKKSPGSDMCYSCIEDSWNNQSEEVKLTDLQVSNAKQVIEDYCADLMDKQSYILAINLINDYPEYVSEYSCNFRCNVVRKDDNVNLATIYLSIDDKGDFKVNRLIYDDN